MENPLHQLDDLLSLRELSDLELEAAREAINWVSTQPSPEGISSLKLAIRHPQLMRESSKALAESGWRSAYEILLERLELSEDDDELLQLISDLGWHASQFKDQTDLCQTLETALLRAMKREVMLDRIADYSSHFSHLDLLFAALTTKAREFIQDYLKNDPYVDFDPIDFYFGYFHGCLARKAVSELLDILEQDVDQTFTWSSAFYYLCLGVEEASRKDATVREALLTGFIRETVAENWYRSHWAMCFLKSFGSARVLPTLIRSLGAQDPRIREHAVSLLEVLLVCNIEGDKLTLSDQTFAIKEELSALSLSGQSEISRHANLFLETWAPASTSKDE